MLKLNNNGWGLRMMLLLTSVILIALLVATFYVIRLYSSIDKQVTSNTKVASKTKDDLDKKYDENVKKHNLNMYEQNENILARNAIYYAEQHDLIIEGNYGIITYDDLIEESYLKSIYDIVDDSECDGYVLISQENGEYNAKGYLKCSNYTTEGYDN